MKKIYTYLLLILILCSCSSAPAAEQSVDERVNVGRTSFVKKAKWMVFEDENAEQKNPIQKNFIFDVTQDPIRDSVSIAEFSDVCFLYNETEAYEISKAYCEAFRDSDVVEVLSDNVALSGTPGYHAIYKDTKGERVFDIYSFPSTAHGMIDFVYIHSGLDDPGFTDEYNAMINDVILPDLIYEKKENDSNGSFTNKYGTPTTKCHHADCNNYIASSGDTWDCTQHANKCLNCGKYIDCDAMYCMDCLEGALSSNSNGSFTNKYGTPTTKCHHADCNNYIASSGDTWDCTQHANKCLNCGKYIDCDAMYCMDCIESSLD